MNLKITVCLSFFLLFCTAPTSAGPNSNGMIILTDENFTQAKAKYEYLVVCFYESPHIPEEYMSAYNELDFEEYAVTFALIDITKELTISAQYGKEIDTIKLFIKSHKKVATFRDTYKTENIVSWVKKKVDDYSQIPLPSPSPVPTPSPPNKSTADYSIIMTVGRLDELIKADKSFEEKLNAIYAVLEKRDQDFQNQLAASHYIGDYKYSAMSANHGHWLLCNGQAVSRVEYSKLFEIIGIQFGEGDKVNTFNLPDFSGRVAGMIGNGHVLGERVGVEKVTLTITQMPSHGHQMKSDLKGALRNEDTPGFDKVPDAIFNQGSAILGYTEATGGNAPHENMQPTTFGGSYFIYSG